MDVSDNEEVAQAPLQTRNPLFSTSWLIPVVKASFCLIIATCSKDVLASLVQKFLKFLGYNLEFCLTVATKINHLKIEKIDLSQTVQELQLKQLVQIQETVKTSAKIENTP